MSPNVIEATFSGESVRRFLEWSGICVYY